MRRLLALCALALTASARADDPSPTPAGQETGLIPREVFFGNPERANVKYSPDGRFLSYVAPRDGVLNVFVGPSGNPADAKPVTDDKKRGVREYFWAFDGRHLIYLQDTGGDENFHAYRVEVATGATTDLTPGKLRAVVEGVSRRRPNEVVIGLNDRDPRFHDVYLFDLAAGTKKLLFQNDQYSGVVVDDDYNLRFAAKVTPDGGTEYVTRDGDSWKPFAKIEMADSTGTRPVGFDKTGTTAYMLDSRGRDTSAVTALDLATRESKVLAENPRADAGGVLIHPTEDTVQAVSFARGKSEWQFLDPAIKADFDALSKVAAGEITVASRTTDDKLWLVQFVMDDGPVRYYRYDRPEKKATFLFTNRPNLEAWKLAKLHAIEIKSRDDLDLVSYLTVPVAADPAQSGKPAKPGPLVLLVHGGPWARDSWGYNGYHQFLANRGYSVLSVNYRGSTGFGKAFLNASTREWAGKMHDDLIDAVNWAVKEGIADPKKVAIMGGSYGGYATLVGLTFTPEVFACGVDIVGPSNLKTLLATIPPYWAPIVDLFKSRVGDPGTPEGAKLLDERSPLTRVGAITKPLLIGQGANDPRVKQAESDQIVAAMKAKSIPVTYVLFPDEGHGFARPQNNGAFNAVAEAFLAKHLGGRYEAAGSAFRGSSITVPAGVEGVPGVAGKLAKE